MEIKYGALAPKLEEQVNAQGFTLGKEANTLEKSRESIIWLTVQDILTDNQKGKALLKLHKQVIKQMKPWLV